MAATAVEATRDRFAGKESAAARSRVMPSGKSHPGRHSGAKSPPTLGSRARADVGAREVAGKTGKLQYLAKKRPKRASDGRVGSPAEKSIITTAASDARSTGVVLLLDIAWPAFGIDIDLRRVDWLSDHQLTFALPSPAVKSATRLSPVAIAGTVAPPPLRHVVL